MPRLIETETRTGTLVAAVNHLLAEGGPRALSLRAVAGASRVSGSSILHHFGSMEHLLRVSAYRTGAARLQRMEERWPFAGVAAHLPTTADDVVDARVWLAWCELWRSHDGLETTVREARRAERALLASRSDFRLAREQLDTVVALLDGLTVAVCRPVEPMAPSRAVALLHTQVRDAQVSDGPPPPRHAAS